LQKIREAKAALEKEAKEKAIAQAAEAVAKRAERERQAAQKGKKATGPKPEMADPEQATPEPKAQRNFTDSESRVMPDGANKGAFVQAYNAQIAVDAEAQVIVAADVTQNTNDVRELVPMAEAIVRNVGALAVTTSADAGYFSAQNVEHAALAATNLLVPPNRQKHGSKLALGSSEPSASPADRMRYKLASEAGRALYKMRKAIVEPVFGQIKGARQLRQFLLRGLDGAKGEWAMITLTHNLLKLFRSGFRTIRPLTA
jgi:Transposase DDE domain